MSELGQAEKPVVGFTPNSGHCLAPPKLTLCAMNRRQPTPSTGQSRATAALSRKLGKVALDGTATNCVTTRTSGSCLGGTGDQHKSLKSFERHKRRL
jgi:hypothetical protein